VKAPIPFYFDFASPYAWFALDRIESLAREHDRVVEWRPILLWTVLKAQGIPPPLDSPVKREYFFADMARSAAFYRVPYRHPANLPLSSHLASRLYHALAVDERARAMAFGRDVFECFFVTNKDISKEAVLLALAARQGIGADAAHDAMNGQLGRARLAAAIDAAVLDKVCGSPSFILDGELFFGADRLDQIAWRLGSKRDMEASARSAAAD
jgi:2-hydroxychromene-2-carboxylate isomerase